MASGKISVSSCIICMNAERFVGWALDSLAWCDEIVVVDSGSTDRTIEICRNHPSGKVRVVSEKWRGYNQQREFATNLCRNDWVLLLDADEECSPELRNEIETLTADRVAAIGLFEMPRKNFVAGKYVRFWSPDYQTRFVHKQRTHWDPSPLPEIRRAKPGFALGRLKKAILHNPKTPVSSKDFCNGAVLEERSLVLADALQRKRRRASFFQLAIRPAATFIKYYIFRGGFLDGRFGLAMAYKIAIGATLKYLVLYGRELAEEETTSRNPEARSENLPASKVSESPS